MDQLISKVETIIEKQIKLFEDKPIATTLKFLLILWVLKFIYRELRK